MPYANQFFKKAGNPAQIIPQAATAFRQMLPKLSARVCDDLCAHPEIHQLTGSNTLALVRSNIRLHGNFMAAFFALGNNDLLVRNLSWLFRCYHAHRYAYEYFPVELNCWDKAVSALLEGQVSHSIRAVYSWIAGNQENLIQLSQADAATILSNMTSATEKRRKFQEAILAGQHQICLKIAKDSVQSAIDIEDFYQNILRPTLHEIGRLWERSVISVAQEHLATAIAGRVMASLRLEEVSASRLQGKAAITTTEHEKHELGALMVADILEYEGWEVSYFGADVPREDLIRTLKTLRPDLLALSISVPCHLISAKETIAAIRQEAELSETRIMVGGYAFEHHSHLWETLNADGLGRNLSEVKALARGWRGV